MTKKEWLQEPSGTKAVRVSTYDDDGNRVDVEYILKQGSYQHEVEQAKEVGLGYYTDSIHVTRK